MIGFVGRFASAIARGDADQDRTAFDTDADGVIWVTRNECRTCQAPIEDPRGKPHARDESELLTNLVSGDDGEPRSTFCSDECLQQFLEVFGNP